MKWINRTKWTSFNMRIYADIIFWRTKNVYVGLMVDADFVNKQCEWYWYGRPQTHRGRSLLFKEVANKINAIRNKHNQTLVYRMFCRLINSEFPGIKTYIQFTSTVSRRRSLRHRSVGIKFIFNNEKRPNQSKQNNIRNTKTREQEKSKRVSFSSIYFEHIARKALVTPTLLYVKDW